MRSKLASFSLLGALLALSIPAFAHHGAAAYDMSKPAVFKDAVVTKYFWANPHTVIFFDAKDDKGTVTHLMIRAVEGEMKAIRQSDLP